MTSALYWTECPECDKTVYVIAGVMREHVKSRQHRRWPKMLEACPRGGKPHHHTPPPEPPQPILEM